MTEREAAAASARPLPPSIEEPITAQEVTTALQLHHLNPESQEARRDMRRTLEQFVDARAASAPQVPLTDDQVRAAYRQVFDSPFAPRIYGLAEQFAREIEAAHGIVPLAPQDGGTP